MELILNNFNLGAFLLGGELAFHLDLFSLASFWLFLMMATLEM